MSNSHDVLRFLYEVINNLLVRRPLQLTKTVFIFLLVCCKYSLLTQTQNEALSTNHIFPESIKIDEIIKGKIFFEKISKSAPNKEFRVFVKADSSNTYRLLNKIG